MWEFEKREKGCVHKGRCVKIVLAHISSPPLLPPPHLPVQEIYAAVPWSRSWSWGEATPDWEIRRWGRAGSTSASVASASGEASAWSSVWGKTGLVLALSQLWSAGYEAADIARAWIWPPFTWLEWALFRLSRCFFWSTNSWWWPFEEPIEQEL